MIPPTDHSAKKGRTRDPELTRAAILAAAREVFVERGFTGARTAEIAEKAGVASGLIYHYFQSKLELFDKVMEEAIAPFFEELIETLSRPPSHNLTLLEGAVRSYFGFLRDHPHVPRLLAWWMADHASDHKALRCKAGLHESAELLGTRRIREAQEAGFIRKDLDPGLVIKTFTDLCMMWFMSRDRLMLHCPPGVDPESLDDIYLEHMVEVFLRGVAADPQRD